MQALSDRIDQRDPTVRAWAFLDTKQVLQQAAALDAVPVTERGVLHGVPIGSECLRGSLLGKGSSSAVKDVILTKDQPTRYHSPMYVPRGLLNHC